MSPVQIARCFGKVLMSNTMLFSSPLGQTYFSVLGNPELISEHKEVPKTVLSIIKFFKSKESDRKVNKKDKSFSSNVQFWSIYILLIINEYSIGRPIAEDNEALKSALTAAELSEIPPEKVNNYVNCVKIINNVVEYMKAISNPKVKEKESVVFIASFIKICSTAQSKNTLPCVMSILAFKKVFTKNQVKKICTYIRKLAEDMTDPDNKQVLIALITEMEAEREVDVIDNDIKLEHIEEEDQDNEDTENM